MNFVFHDHLIDQKRQLSELSASCDQKLCGRLAYRNRGRVRLYAIEVEPEFRMQGVAGALMQQLIRLTKDREGYVLEALLKKEQQETEEENDLSYFLWRMGFEPADENDKYTHYELWLEKSKQDQTEGDVPEAAEAKTDEASERSFNERYQESREEERAKIEDFMAMTPLTNKDLICAGCIYHTEETDVLSCHKYATKPYEVLTDDTCPLYTEYI